jgi:hypothetical protein
MQQPAPTVRGSIVRYRAHCKAQASLSPEQWHALVQMIYRQNRSGQARYVVIEAKGTDLVYEFSAVAILTPLDAIQPSIPLIGTVRFDGARLDLYTLQRVS